jgi:hypothetical protein
MKKLLLALALAWVGCHHVQAQNPAPQPADAQKARSQSSQPPAAKTVIPLQLEEVGPVRTEDAARRAAQELLKPQNPQSNDAAGNQPKKEAGVPARDFAPEATKPVPDDAVMEFQPAPAGSTAKAVPAKDGRASPLNRVHGDLYGRAGAGGHATGESVGATSKSGKTSVYVEVGQTQATSPQTQPH